MSFSPDFFTSNRKNLANKIKNGIIVLTAHGQVQRSGDTTLPFRQDSNFWYLTGITKPDILLVIIPGEEEFLILPKRTAMQEIFDGAYSSEDLQKTSGIKKSYSYDEGWEKLKKAATSVGSVYTLVTEDSQTAGLFINPAKLFLVTDLRRSVGNEKIKSIATELVNMRMIKQSAELEAIQQAIDITVDGFKDVMKLGWHDRYKQEAEIHAEFAHHFMKNGSVAAYAPIVAAGKNACTLHYIDNNAPISKKDVLLIDAAAEYSLYAADITRVYKPIAFTDREKSVFEAVRSANELAQDMAKPGATLKEIELAVEKSLGEFLKSASLISTNERSDIRRYYPHAVSHHLGLDVHDAADYTKPLEEGMVITVEPGLYIPEWKLGIRLEDDIGITKAGHKNLSADLPYSLG